MKDLTTRICPQYGTVKFNASDLGVDKIRVADSFQIAEGFTGEFNPVDVLPQEETQYSILIDGLMTGVTVNLRPMGLVGQGARILYQPIEGESTLIRVYPVP